MQREQLQISHHLYLSMKQRTLLIATTNQGKFQEIEAVFRSLPFELLALSDLPEPIEAPEEYGKTIEENALIKAMYYGNATGHLTLADDAGMFIDAFDGWPGVITDRIADSRQEKIDLVLSKVAEVDNRNAAFRVCSALYDPKSTSTHITTGRMPFVIAEAPVTTNLQTDWGYTPIMYLPEIGKVYGELSLKETREYSHRYRALRSMLYHIESNYAHKNIPVGFALVVQNRKVLMQLRNDPGNPNFHRRWEFPGGGIDFGETMHQNIIRETKEESGLDVKVEKLLQHVQIESHVGRSRPYQIILLPFVCSVVGGSISHCDVEVLDAQWFAIDDILEQPLVGNNKNLIQNLLPELKEFLQDNPL